MYFESPNENNYPITDRWTIACILLSLSPSWTLKDAYCTLRSLKWRREGKREKWVASVFLRPNIEIGTSFVLSLSLSLSLSLLTLRMSLRTCNELLSSHGGKATQHKTNCSTLVYPLIQACTKCGPRAACGPRDPDLRPAVAFFNVKNLCTVFFLALNIQIFFPPSAEKSDTKKLVCWFF